MKLSKILGWDVLSFLLILLGILSTILNVLQVLNGVFCFDRIPNIIGLHETFSSISTDFQRDNVMSNDFCKENTSDGYNIKLFTVRPGGYMSVKIKFDCNNPIATNNTLYVNPSSIFVMPDSVPNIGYAGSVLADSGFCVLQSRTYQLFAIFSLMFFLSLLLIRTLIRTVLFEYTAGLFFSKHTHWIYLLLDKLEMFNHCNPYQSYPLKVNEHDDFFEFSDGDGLQFDDISAYSYHDSSSNYTFNYRCNILDVTAIDKSGMCRILEPADAVTSSKLRACIKFRAEKKMIITNNHFLSIEECYNEIKSGKNLIKSKNNPKTLFGINLVEIKFDTELMAKLKIHMQRFFGYYSYELLFQALKSHHYDSSLPIRNSEWKLYLSDLYFHFGLKSGSKSKKYKPSKSFLSEEPVEIVNDFEMGLLLNDKVQEKKNLHRDDVSDDKSTTISIRSNASYSKELITFPVEESGVANNKRLVTLAKENNNGQLSKKFLDAMIDYHEYFFESSFLSENKINRNIFNGKAAGGPEKFMYHKGLINTRNWVAANDPDYLQIDQYYSWYCRKPNPKVITVKEFEDISPIIEVYKEKLREVDSLLKEITRLVDYERLERVVQRGRLEEKLLEDYQVEYRDATSKNGRKRAEKKIIDQQAVIDKVSEDVKSNHELKMIRNYRKLLAIAKEAVKEPAHKNCVRYFTGCSNDCYFDYVCESTERVFEVNDSALDNHVNKLRAKLKKTAKSQFRQLIDPIAESFKSMLKNGKRPSINRFKFNHGDHKHYLPVKIKKNLKNLYKKTVNDAKLYNWDRSGMDSERDFWVKNAEIVHCIDLVGKILHMDPILYKKLGNGSHPPMLNRMKYWHKWFMEKNEMVESLERLLNL